MRHKGFLFVLSVVALGHAAFAQVQVSEEPMHHKVFDNDWVRVLDVHIPAGDTSQWHKHSTPSVFLILSSTKTGSQVRVEPGKPSFADGNIWFEGFYDTPRIHRVWNDDDHEFHVIDMELPHKPNGEIDPPLKDPAFKLLFDERPVRGYRMTLAAKRSLHLKSGKANMMVVRVDEGDDVKVNYKILQKKGDYVFIPAGVARDFQNTGQADVKLAVFEMK